MERLGDIAILGGGFGALSALRQLVVAAPAGTRIDLVVGPGWCGRGLAYATGDPHHLLNVRTCRMGIDAGQPEGFQHWLSRRGDGSDHPDRFQPRGLFGAYLQACWRETLERAGRSGLRLGVLPCRAEEVTPGPDAVRVRLADGRRIVARAALASPGPLAPAPLAPDGDRWISALWPCGGDRLGALSGTVLVAGTGLTAVDVAASLLASPAVRQIMMVSLDGVLPLPHAVAPAPMSGPFGPHLSPRALTAAVRARCRSEPWQGVFERLRCDLPDCWAGWSLRERRQALRHLARLWTPRRNRADPAVLARLERAERQGRLVRHRGRLDRIEPGPAGIVALGAGLQMVADAGIDARGIARITGRGTSLLDRAVAAGVLRLSPTGFGIAADAAHCASAPGLAPLHVIGAPRLGDLVETTGATEVRVQAREAAAALLSFLARG